MAWYPYSWMTAFDPTTGERAPVGSVGQIFAVGDTAFAAPLQPFDLAGLAVELAVQNDIGYIPNFQVEDQTSVIWKSGDYIFELTTTMPLPGPAGAKIVDATEAAGELTFELTDGSTVGPVPIPPGPQGERGPAGYNATGAVEDQQTLADYVAETAGANPFSGELKATFASKAEALTKAEADASYATTQSLSAALPHPSWGTDARPFDPRLGTFNCRPDNMPHWRAARARGAAGLGTGHVACPLDSITYGAAGSGVSLPKPENSWPGRLRRALDAEYGSAGSGIVYAWDTLLTSPADDPRWTFTGTIAAHEFGPHQKSCVRFTDSAGANWVEFTDTCTEFVIYTVAGGSRPRVMVDGGAELLIAGQANMDPSIIDYAPEPGYQSNGTEGQIVTVIPAGALGTHTLRILSPTNGIAYVNIIGIEARASTTNGIRVTGLARNGLATSDLVTDAGLTNNYLYGMDWTFDATNADLAIMLLAMNDYQGHVPVATFKANVTAAVQRQKSSAPFKANGDVLLVTCAQPDYNYPIPADGVFVPPLSEYFMALYEVADEQDVPLLDLAHRWQDFPTSDALGYFGDPLHPGDLGSEDIAAAVRNVLQAV